VTRSFAEFVATADAELRDIQAQLLARARERLAAGLRRDITTRAEAEEFFTSGTGFVLAGWCGSPVCEVAFKPLGVTIRCLPTEERATSDSCLACGRPSVSPAVFAASY
jgi:prolyl-tRNA synthetase